MIKKITVERLSEEEESKMEQTDFIHRNFTKGWLKIDAMWIQMFHDVIKTQKTESKDGYPLSI